MHTEPALTALLAPREALPLRYHTPDSWAAQALAEPLALLGDHAHLERKAGANALELINRWPGAVCPAARGGTLPRVHRNHCSAATRAAHAQRRISPVGANLLGVGL